MASIARMNAMLTATSGGFSAGLKQGEKALSSFKSTFSAVALATAAYDLGKQAITGAYNATVGLVASSIESIGALHDQAAQLGITTDALARLQFAAKDAGVDGEALTGSLTKMNKTLADAVTKGGPAAAAFSRLGLDAKTLANEAPEKAFSDIAEAISQIQNPAERAQASMAIFGKSGAALIPIMQEGAQGLAAAALTADALGLSMSQLDANKVDDAGDAMGHVGDLIQGIGNQLAVGLAPYITSLSNLFIQMAIDGGGIGPKVSSALEMIVGGIATAADYVSLLQAGWYSLKTVVLGFATTIIKALDLVGEAMHELTNLLGLTEGDYEGFSTVVDQFAQDTVDSFDKAAQAVQDFKSGKNSKGVADFFQKARDEAQKAAEAAGGPTQGQMTTALPDVDATAAKEAQKQAEDASKAAAREAERGQKQAEDAAKRYYESTRSAAEKYAEELQRINDLQTKGLLDSDTAQRAKDAAQKALDAANAKDNQPTDTTAKTPDGPKLLQAGSQEAASFVAQIQRRSESGGETKTLVKQGDTTNKYLETLVKNTSPNTTPDTVVNL